jgi:hypothetical protein
MLLRTAASASALALAFTVAGPVRAGDQLSGAAFNELSEYSTLDDSDTISDTDTVSEMGTLYDTVDDSFNSDDSSVDYSSHYKNSGNVTDSYNSTGNVFASPIAAGVLTGYVSNNFVAVAALAGGGSSATTKANSSVSLSGSALSGFTGVNSTNLNAGVNSFQQTNVSIAVVSVTP